MAKLNKNLAKQAAEKAADWDGTGVVPAGVYLCKLTKVDTTKSGPAGPYWEWEFEVVGVGSEPKGKKFWDNTSLSPKAIGRVGKTFEAFGTTPDADTEDLIGDLVAVSVTIGTIAKGDRMGEPRNEVQSLRSAESHALFDEWENDTRPTAGAGTAASDFE